MINGLAAVSEEKDASANSRVDAYGSHSPQSRLRVLVVSHYFPEHGSGIELLAHQIASRLVARGFAIEWVASREVSLGPSRAPGARGEPAWNITERLFGIPYPIWSPFAFSRLLDAVRRCDVVHLHDTLYMGNLLAFVAARIGRKPILVTQHIGLIPYRNPIFKAMMETANRHFAARVLKHSSSVVFYSRTAEQYFRRLLPHGLSSNWIANGVDRTLFFPRAGEARDELRRDLGWPQDRTVLLFVGRFVEKKGIQIIKRLAELFPEPLWVLVGWGPHNPGAWNLSNVVCLGKCDQSRIAQCYQAADLLVLPSVGEGFPLVVQESMACGTPVVVTTETAAAHAGVAELVYAAEPTVESFSSLLKSVLAAPSALSHRRAAVAAFAQREWNWERCVDRYAELLDDVVAREV